jgi:hypothetical protein
MVCGIYVLKFNGTNKVYIGQSENISYRFRKHLEKMCRGETALKLQKAYNMYGEPRLEILLECSPSELNYNEKEAIEIYNAVENGFNTAKEPDIHLRGDKNGASKYSNNDVSKVLDYLLDVLLSYKDIEALTGVKENTVRHIANSESHMWLKEVYPEKYAKMLEVKPLRISMRTSAGYKGKTYPALISPEGVVYDNINNVSIFAREHNLDGSSITKILNKRPKYHSHKGWKLLQLPND